MENMEYATLNKKFKIQMYSFDYSVDLQ